MKYNVTFDSKAIYEQNSSLHTSEQARALAKEWFPEYKLDSEFQTLAPCEVNGQCPYDDCNCSLCR